jgi:hypothetical protein
MSLEDLFVERRVPSEPGVWRGWEKRPATREDVLTAVRELGGAEVEVSEVNASYGRTPKVVSSDHAFIDMDHEIGTDLLPGRYLIVPLDTGDTE